MRARQAEEVRHLHDEDAPGERIVEEGRNRRTPSNKDKITEALHGARATSGVALQHASEALKGDREMVGERKDGSWSQCRGEEGF